MRRTALVFTAGAVASLLGICLILGAHSLATHWESTGSGAWGGTTDPGQMFAYRMIGLVVLIFGLTLETLAFYRWLGGETPGHRDRPT
jgi:hypothetical protein